MTQTTQTTHSRLTHLLTQAWRDKLLNPWRYNDIQYTDGEVELLLDR